MKRRISILEERAVNILEHHKILGFVREYKFHPTRQWRFDIAFIEQKIAIELEGGVFSRTIGGHSRGAGYTKDTEKYNQAVVFGWRVLRYTVKNIYSIPIDLMALGVSCEIKL